MVRANQKDLDELADACTSAASEFVVSKWIVERVPYIFQNDYDCYINTKISIAKKLGVDACSIVFVGSCSTGFSLNPKKNFKVFDDDSDIDIAVISHHYFNIAWHWMRMQDESLLTYKAKKAIKNHRSWYVFDGAIATDFILPLLPFGKEWQSVIADLEKDPMFQGKDINFRLYQDHKSLIDYHIKNIKKNLPQLLGVEPESKDL